MIEFFLPVDWQVTSIGELCEKVTDGSHNPPKPETVGLPMLSAKNIFAGNIHFDVNHRLIQNESFDLEDRRTRISTNDVLLTVVGTLGRVALVTNNLPRFTVQRSVAVVSASKINPQFLRYSLEQPSFQKQIFENAKGTAQKGLYLNKLKMLQLPLPSQAEQKQIATKLDELLAQVDTIKTRLDTIPSILKRFRQSVLGAAVSGKLTEEWRVENQMDKTADKIKQEISEYRIKTWEKGQNAKFKYKGTFPKNDRWKKKYKEPVYPDEIELKDLPKGWVYEPLDGLVYIAARIGWKGLKASEYTQEGPLFLSVHGLNYGQYVNLDKAFNISEERYDESPEIKLKNEDILLCKDGAGIGKIAIVKGLDEPASINSSLLLIRAGKYFKTKYLYYFLAGPVMQKLVQERMTGTAVPHLFQRDVKKFVLEVPPLDEQTEIIRRVELLLDYADKIEKIVKSAQSRVNSLTQSILAKAFRGELTTEWREQNPDLITGKNSVTVLLEKMKVEREKIQMLKPKKKKKKRKKAMV